ncbi:MAG: hypothetical protein IKC03_07775 [Oscillospiraceae bacterium]|nr:hypothetical protein [Oscillospiraceae bacterium]
MIDTGGEMMSIKLTIHPGRLTVLMKRTKDSVSQITEAARDSVSVVSIKAEDVLTQSRLQREIADLKEEIDLQMQAVGELLYATHRGKPSNSEEMQKILDYLDSLYEQMEGHQEQLSFLRDFYPHSEPNRRQNPCDCTCDENSLDCCGNHTACRCESDQVCSCETSDLPCDN